MIPIQFNTQVLGPSIVSGLAQAGLYGLLAITLVLSYRVSRTVAFFNAGLAMMGATGYWWIAYDSPNYDGLQPNLPEFAAVGILGVVGAVLGAAYGALVTGRRMVTWPKITLTIFSLGAMLTLAGFVHMRFPFTPDRPPSPFGRSKFPVFGFYVTTHQVVMICFFAVVGAGLAFVLSRTRTGIFLRAIADDAEAGRWVGVPMYNIGVSVYAVAGALSALAGVLISPIYGPNVLYIYFPFLRALSAAVLGGFTSFGLAIAGAGLFGLSDSSIRSGLFGHSTLAQQEIFTTAVIFLAVIFITRRRKSPTALAKTTI